MNEMSERDRELTRRLRATLDRSVQSADPALDRALAATRARALGEQLPQQKALRPWLWASGMALAAGLAMFVVLPGSNTAPVKPALHASQVSSPAARAPIEDPEMLDDMDMLQALAAQPAAPGQG